MKQWPPERIDALIGDLETARPKLVIDDVRMRLMPAALKAYFDIRFATFWPSINVYAPIVSPSETQFDLWFDGDYRVEPSSGSAVVDGVDHAAGSVVRLRRGAHRNGSASTMRLRLQPPVAVAPGDVATGGRRPMFARAYDY